MATNFYDFRLVIRATSVPEDRVLQRLQTLDAYSVEFRDSVACVRMKMKASSLDAAFAHAQAIVEATGFRVVAVGPDDLSTVEDMAEHFLKDVDEVARWVHNGRALRFPDVRGWSQGKPLWSRCEVAEWAIRHRLVDRNARKVAVEFHSLATRLRHLVDQTDEDVNDFVQQVPFVQPPGGYKPTDFE